MNIYFTETWYLVDYEDDGNLRVLGEDEIRHIFPDEDDEIQAGDIVSALWRPNGQFYDAKVLQKGGKFHFTALNCDQKSIVNSLSKEGHLSL